MTKYPTIKRLISFVLALTMVLSLVPANGLHVHAHEAEETVIAETSPAVPTETPTEKSTEAPTEEPTEIPTEEPTQAPTEMPTQQPTEAPTEAPMEKPLIVENKVVAKSAAKASSPSYIASIGIAQDGSSGNTGINDCKNQLAGHTIIDCDLNKGCGATSDYIYMGYMTTTDPSQAITGILLREGKNPPHSITYRDYTFNLVGGLYESNTADLGGLKDLNGGAGGAYIYMYVTRSPGYGPALTALTVTESTSAPSGYVNVTDNNGSLLDMNKGADGAYLYLHARKYSATVNVTFNYVDENGRHSATSTKQLNNHLDVLQGAKTVPAAFTYSDIYWELIGWRDDNTAGPREYGNMDIVVGPDSTNKVYNAVYHSNNGGLVSYDANGGTGNMTAGDFSEYCYGQYMNAGTSSIQYAMAPYKLKTFPDMTYPGKCAFLGWSLDKNATTPTYADGETVTFPSNLTLLYAVWKDHSNEKLNLTNNGDTHTYFRSCCLKAVTENHYDNNRDGLCDLCGGSTDQPAQSSGVYQITNKAELIWFMQHVNRGNKGANAKVVNNIDMGGYNWTPIAQTDLYYKTTSYADKGYTGTFDGNNKVISNFKITASTTVEQTYGLFGTVSGTVRNLGVTGVSYIFPSGTKDLRAGGIVGQMLPGSRVENSYVAHSTITPGQYIVGGIAACNYGGAIENCYTYKVSVSGHARCGNLVSDTRGDISSSDRPGTVKNCYTDATRMAGTQSGGKLIGCAENVSAARFASGEIACKLGAAWGQTIGTDALPVLGGAKVYEVKKCDGETTWSNASTNPQDHVFVNYICSICGTTDSNAAAEVIMNGKVVSAHANLNDAIQAVSSATEADNAVVKLLQDMELTAVQEIKSGIFTLDLNDQTITGGSAQVLRIFGGIVTIDDSGENGAIQSVYANYGAETVHIRNATVNIMDGTIRSGAEYGTGVYLGSGILTISGGEIMDGNEGVYVNSGTVQINGGTITEAQNGVCLYNGTVQITGGTITNMPIAVYVMGGTAQVSGGKITETSYGVYAVGGTVEISGGENTSDRYGIEVSGGDVTISGGSINGSTYDIYYSGGTVMLTLAEGKTEGATFPNEIRIYGTTLKAILGEGAAYWQGDRQVNITDRQNLISRGDVVIKKACPHAGDKNYTDNGDGTHTWSCADCRNDIIENHEFDEETLLCLCGAVSPDAVAQTTLGGTVTYHTTLSAAIQAVSSAAEEDEAVVKILQDIELTAERNIASGVFTLDLNDQTITGSTEYALTITGGTVTIADSGENKDAGIIRSTIQYGAPLNVDGGNVTITSGSISGDYGVYMRSGEVNISGGNITGGVDAVYMIDGELNISDGTITGYITGVYMFDGEVNISGGTMTGGYGLSMKNGEGHISDGTMTGSTYGVFVGGGKMTISGGSISGDFIGMSVARSEMTITGGSITSGGNDIWYNSGTVKLTLAEGKPEGAIFPGGITVLGTTLEAILGEGAAYWQDSKMIIVDDDVEITGSDVVIKAVCPHAGDKNYTDNGDGTHTWNCADCRNDIIENHEFDEETLLCLCGAVSSEAAVVVRKNDKVVSAYTTLGAAITAVADATDEDKAVVKILKSMELTTQQEITSGVFTLDLNDQTITGSTKYVLYITGGTVTIDDSGENGTIYCASKGTDNYALNIEGGSLAVIGGYIAGGQYAVYNNGGTVSICGGTISDAYMGVQNLRGSVSITGGTITNVNYCVYNTYGTVCISGGVLNGISGNGVGYGVYNYQGNVSIRGGTISITGIGCAVSGDFGTIDITGGSITGGLADDISGEYNCDLKASEDTLTLALAEGKMEGATFPGGIKVRGITLAEILGEGAAYWQGDQQVNLTEDQTEITDGDVVIKAACSHTGDKNYTDNGDGTHTWSCTGCNSNITEDHQFNKETLLCNCGAVSSEAAVVVSKNGKIVSAHTTLNAAITVVADATDEDKAVVKVLKPIELTAQQYIDSGVFTLDLNDQTITGSGDQVFYISGGTVTIDDSGENGTITGSYDGMHVAGGNVEISGGTISGYDYGVYNINNGTTTISGGSITGGTRGVVSNSGIVTISGGSISGGSYGVMNTKGTATISGGTITSGRIAVQNNDGTASITGGTITGGDITDGTITYNAFGVYNINNGTTTISGGTITGDGIGVDADSGSVNITGGTISGGNCGVDNFDSTVTISGGSISGGNCGVENNSTVTISGGTISGGNYGVENNSTVTITGGTITGGDITDGTITYNAYGVYNNSTVTISGGTITGDGFGVYALLGTVTISGGTISSNAYAVGNENGTATISGGTITGKVSDINNDIGILTLTLGEDGTGATFPGGIKVRGTTLAEILGEGAAYWQGDQQVNLTEDQTEITDGDVVIKAAVCDHSGNENADDGDCTTELICSVCGKAALEAKTAHEYGANHFCTVEYCNAEEPVYVAFHSLSLKGNIGVNYYLHIDESILADETGFMRFVTPRGGTVEIPISQAAQKTAGGKTYYGFTATVAAKEMTDIVQGQYIYSNGTSTVKEYSVKQYADIILANESNSAAFTKAQPLVQAMLTYGAYAQQEFGYNTDRLAGELADVSTVTAETLASFAGNGPQGTTLAPLYASSLLLKTETTMRLIFAPDATVSELTATMNGKAMDVTMKSGYALVNISSISAKDLDAAYTVTINDGAETADVTYTPMTYCYNVLKDSSGTFGATTQDLVKALYLYNQAANTYFS